MAGSGGADIAEHDNYSRWPMIRTRVVAVAAAAAYWVQCLDAQSGSGQVSGTD